MNDTPSAATHWRDEGAVAIEPGTLTILDGARPDWAPLLSKLPGVNAVILDDQHIAIRIDAG